MFLYRFSWYVGVVIWARGIPISLDPLIINRLLAEKPSTFRRREGGGSAKGRRRFGEEKAEVRRREGGGSAKNHHCSPIPALRADPPPPRGGINYN